MREEATTVERSLGILRDLDLREDGSWVGVFERPDGLQVADSYGRAFTLGRTLRYPIVRAVGFDRVVVVDARPVPTTPGGFIFSLTSAYTGFELVYVNPRTSMQTLQPLPKKLHGASALSIHGEDAYLFGPYDHKRVLFHWRKGRAPQELGTHSGPLRGLRNGRFLSVGEHGFAVVDCRGAG